MKTYDWATPPESIPAERITKQETADVVVIGAGHVGTCAARGAAEAGASVIVLEQQTEEKQQVTYQAPCHAVFDYTDPAECAKLKKALESAQQNKGSRLSVRDKAGDVRPFYCADTLEELAAILFEDADAQKNFLREVARYNELCRAGHDSDFGKDPHLLFPIEKAPFYACGTRKDSHFPGGQSLKLLVTVSGLLIDEHQQVLDADFEPIPGLFATGNCSGCRFGFQYTTSLPGQSISMAQTLGREAGRWIAAF